MESSAKFFFFWVSISVALICNVCAENPPHVATDGGSAGIMPFGLFQSPAVDETTIAGVSVARHSGRQDGSWVGGFWPLIDWEVALREEGGMGWEATCFRGFYCGARLGKPTLG
ncbi:hypothetical protein Dimus_019628 [Dionaea muscipula]